MSLCVTIEASFIRLSQDILALFDRIGSEKGLSIPRFCNIKTQIISMYYARIEQLKAS